MTPANFTKQRKALVKAIIAQIKPFLWKSRYVRHTGRGESRPLLIWVPRDANGKPLDKTYKLKGGFVLQEFEGFSEDGVITDSYGGGLATVYWGGLPIEDLYRLNQWMLRMLPKLTAYDQAAKEKAKSAARAARSTSSAGAQAAA